MRQIFGAAIIALVIGLSGCAPLGIIAPSPQSAAFVGRFPENMQGIVILKPRDTNERMHFDNSSWDGPAGLYGLRVNDSTKAPYVLMMLPPGRYTLRKLYSYNYWLEINKAVVTVSEGAFIGEPSFQVTAGKVTYLGDIQAGSSPVKTTGGLFAQPKMVTSIVVEDNYDDASLYLQQNFQQLRPYLQSGLIAATGDVIKLEAKQ